MAHGFWCVCIAVTSPDNSKLDWRSLIFRSVLQYKPRFRALAKEERWPRKLMILWTEENVALSDLEWLCLKFTQLYCRTRGLVAPIVKSQHIGSFIRAPYVTTKFRQSGTAAENVLNTWYLEHREMLIKASNWSSLSEIGCFVLYEGTDVIVADTFL